VDIVGDMTVHALLRRIQERLALVAVLANHIGMQAQQRESGEIVIEPNILRPTTLIVTSLATFTELTLVHLIGFMATNASGCGQGDVGLDLMAISAEELAVRAIKRESGVLGVIEAHVQPFGRLMTASALRAVDALVAIVHLVTAVAVRLHGLFEFVALVTGLAHQNPMGPGEPEACSHKVIEKHFAPLGRGVAALAVLTIGAHVVVILQMTVNALVRCIDVLLVHVAVRTGHFHVTPGQEEFRGVVIENGVRPGSLGVTITTNLAQIAHVLIVFHMAGKAFGGRRVKKLITGVTVLADDVPMAAQEREVRYIVIEVIGIQAQHVGVTPLVVGMTDRALRLHHGIGETMKSHGSIQVRSDLFMTVKAQIPLQAAGKRHVTGIAVRLVLGVSLDDWPRHDEALQRRNLGARDAGHHERCDHRCRN